MRFLRVEKWDEHQHYHDGRRPSWIKFYVALLNPARHPKYAAMTDLAKLTLHHLWLLAAECNNRIPEAWLNRDRLNMQTKPKIDELLSAGAIAFAVDDSREESSVSSSPHASVSVSNSPSSSVLDSWQESAFDEMWAQYPRRIGKKGALRHFRASVRDAQDLDAVRTALRHYMASPEVLRGFIQHGSTWFNNWRDWVDVVPTLPFVPPSVPPAGASAPCAVMVDDVRDVERELRGDWTRTDATPEQARAWVHHIRHDLGGDLTEAPTLKAWAETGRTA